MPFKPFDVLENTEVNIWELPLTVMDVTLYNPDRRNLSPEEAYEETIKCIEAVKKAGGVFVLLWHNATIDSSGYWGKFTGVYEKVMEYIGAQNAFVSSGREIIEWWAEGLNSSDVLCGRGVAE